MEKSKTREEECHAHSAKRFCKASREGDGTDEKSQRDRYNAVKRGGAPHGGAGDWLLVALCSGA